MDPLRSGAVQNRWGVRLVTVKAAAFRRVQVALIPQVGAQIGVIQMTREECRELAYLLRAVADS